MTKKSIQKKTQNFTIKNDKKSMIKTYYFCEFFDETKNPQKLQKIEKITPSEIK